MKKTLSFILAVMMLLGCMSITAFANTTPAGMWSYDSTTKTFTVNCTIPEMMEVGSSIPTQVQITGSCSGVTAFGAAWGKVYADNGFAYNGKKWNDPRLAQEKEFVAGEEYGYLIYINYQPFELGDLSGAKIVLNGKEYDVEVSIPYDKDDVDDSTSSQIFIAIDFGVLNENGSFSGGDFAEPEESADPTAKSGNSEITAKIKTAGFEYEMVIPTATTLTEANHENVLLGADGKVSITNVKNGTDKVNVYYTVDLTNGTLTDGTNTIAATYKYKQGDAQFAAIDGTTKVTVYENATVKDSLVNVTADDTQWKAAPTGTYNATVTFDFTTEQSTLPLPETITVFELLGNDETPWWNGLCLMKATVLTEEWFEEGEFYLINEFYPLAANLELTKNQEGNYLATNECGTITFVMEGNNCTSFVIDNYCYEEIAYNGTYKPEPKVTVGSVVNGKSYSGTALMNEHPSISTKIENEKFIIVYGSQDLYEIPLSTELSFCGMNTGNKQYIYPDENGSVTFSVRVADGQCTHIRFGVDGINVIE